MALERINTTVKMNKGGLEDVIAFAKNRFKAGEFAEIKDTGIGSVTISYAGDLAVISRAKESYIVVGPTELVKRFAVKEYVTKEEDLGDGEYQITLNF